MQQAILLFEAFDALGQIQYLLCVIDNARFEIVDIKLNDLRHTGEIGRFHEIHGRESQPLAGLRSFITVAPVVPYPPQRSQRHSRRVLISPLGMAAYRVDVDTVEQQGEAACSRARLQPDAGSATQTGPLRVASSAARSQKPEASAIVQQQLDPIALPVVKREHCARERIDLHRMLDHHDQAVHAHAEGDRPAMQVDPRAITKPEH